MMTQVEFQALTFLLQLSADGFGIIPATFPTPAVQLPHTQEQLFLTIDIASVRRRHDDCRGGMYPNMDYNTDGNRSVFYEN
jgi:hypothetical protein